MCCITFALKLFICLSGDRGGSSPEETPYIIIANHDHGKQDSFETLAFIPDL